MATQIPAQMSGTVWKVEKQVGDAVAVGEVLVILESMKMEIPHESPIAGKVLEIKKLPAESVSEGDVLMVVG